jgi:hypothetical protein
MSTAPTLATAEELFMMPDDGFRYELVRGETRGGLRRWDGVQDRFGP